MRELEIWYVDGSYEQLKDIANFEIGERLLSYKCSTELDLRHNRWTMIPFQQIRKFRSATFND